MVTDLTRPIVGIENRTAQEVFDIMCDRIKAEFGTEEAPRYTTRRLREEVRKAEERGRQHEREAALSTDAEPVAEIVEANTPAAQLLYGFDVKFHEAIRGLPIGTKLYAGLHNQAPVGSVNSNLLAALKLAKDHSELEDEILDIVDGAIKAGSALSAQVQDVAGSSADMKELQSWVYQQRVSLQTNDPEYFAKYGAWKAVGAQIRAMLAAAPAAKQEEKP